VESAISKTLNERPGVVGSFQDGDVRYGPRRKNEHSVKAVISFPKTIFGLKEEILV
jgi:hypothetical protein